MAEAVKVEREGVGVGTEKHGADSEMTLAWR